MAQFRPCLVSADLEGGRSMVMSSGIIVALAIYCARFPRWAVLKRNSGRFIFVSSEAAAEVHPDINHYGVTKTGQVVVARGFNPDLHTQFGKTADTWKASPDGANNTGWKPMLCYFALGTGTRGMEILLQALPRTRRDLATA